MMYRRDLTTLFGTTMQQISVRIIRLITVYQYPMTKQVNGEKVFGEKNWALKQQSNILTIAKGQKTNDLTYFKALHE